MTYLVQSKVLDLKALKVFLKESCDSVEYFENKKKLFEFVWEFADERIKNAAKQAGFNYYKSTLEDYIENIDDFHDTIEDFIDDYWDSNFKNYKKLEYKYIDLAAS